MTMVLEKSEATADTFQIVVADRGASARDAIKRALTGAVKGARVTEAGDLASLTRLLGRGCSVDLLILDLAMPGIGGFAGLFYLRSQHADIPVIVVSDTSDPNLIRCCIEAGAAGYIPKSADIETMREAIGLVIAGEIWVPRTCEASAPPAPEAKDVLRRLDNLTPQQLRVLMLLGQGLLNKQVAYALTISEATVKAHVSAILQKLGVDNRTQAVGVVSRISGNLFAPPAKA